MDPNAHPPPPFTHMTEYVTSKAFKDISAIIYYYKVVRRADNDSNNYPTLLSTPLTPHLYPNLDPNVLFNTIRSLPLE